MMVECQCVLLLEVLTLTALLTLTLLSTSQSEEMVCNKLYSTCFQVLVVTSELCVVSVDIPIIFLACESRVCVTVTIVDDDSVDNTETVNIALERPEDLDRRISIRNGRGQIIIADDSTDGVCVHVCTCVSNVQSLTISCRGCGSFCVKSLHSCRGDRWGG